MNLIPWLAVLVAVGLIAYLVHRFFRGDSARSEGGREGDWPLPPIVFPTVRNAGGAADGNGPDGEGSRSGELLGGDRRGFRPATDLGRPASTPDWPARQPPAPSPGPPQRSLPAIESQSTPTPGGGTVSANRSSTHSLVDAAPIPDGTLQLLPGRLEVLGEDGEQGEVRFVRVPGEEPEVTFGRSEGPPHRHVQLRAPTVSRMHALMRFEDGRWSVSNLSRTNPVVINGGDMADDETERPLEDGDRIEMGEVGFVFHSR